MIIDFSLSVGSTENSRLPASIQHDYFKRGQQKTLFNATTTVAVGLLQNGMV